jgi:hypothetical protein
MQAYVRITSAIFLYIKMEVLKYTIQKPEQHELENGAALPEDGIPSSNVLEEASPQIFLARLFYFSITLAL